MSADVDWSAVAKMHGGDGGGGCSCGVDACRVLAQVERQRRESMLPGPPPRVRSFESVFAPGEVER
ncbi:hypothetical protein AB0I28_19765 [Phytomonospora sp. NPDC050363]|uniref:hypothetical protein n=1 Tax=Phytomonospora sp. NPDC050363 TaxID=3155642 RepID=UPI0033D18A64